MEEAFPQGVQFARGGPLAERSEVHEEERAWNDAEGGGPEVVAEPDARDPEQIIEEEERGTRGEAQETDNFPSFGSDGFADRVEKGTAGEQASDSLAGDAAADEERGVGADLGADPGVKQAWQDAEEGPGGEVEEDDRETEDRGKDEKGDERQGAPGAELTEGISQAAGWGRGRGEAGERSGQPTETNPPAPPARAKGRGWGWLPDAVHEVFRGALREAEPV